jgi:hypothetical protein
VPNRNGRSPFNLSIERVETIITSKSGRNRGTDAA